MADGAVASINSTCSKTQVHGGTLTDQEAMDVAEYLTHQPRAVFSGKAKDWLQGDKPKDARS